MAQWIPVTVIFVYLAVVLYIGIFAFRRGKATGEDFFLASRSIGSIVFFLSLFATNMTAFAILGSSGAAFKQGIGIFGMMATSSCLVIPLTLFFIGTRLWAVGKRFGHMTQVAFFRDRWECSEIGTVIFLVTAAMVIPYLIISIVGGGTILESLTAGRISYPLGGAIVALVVMANVFFGGMRGAVWVNVFQTILFLSFGLIAFLVIGHHLPNGFSGTVAGMISDTRNAAPTANLRPATLLTRERIPWQVFLSFTLIPLSSIMFPHMSIMCFTARKVTAFRKTVVLYPLCIMAIWLPCVFLGALGPSQPTVSLAMAMGSEDVSEFLETGGGKMANGHQPAQSLRDALIKNPKAAPLLADVAAHKLTPEQFGQRLADLAKAAPPLKGELAKLAASNSDSVLLQMLKAYAPAWLVGLLAAGIISAVMGSDCHQILGLSTMFTKDLFQYYGHSERLGEKGTVMVGRIFILVLNGLAYLVALGKPPIFELAVTYAFAGFAAMSPLMLAALFWRRSTKYGALAATLWVATCIAAQLLAENVHPEAGKVFLQIGDQKILFLTALKKLSFMNFTTVVPIVFGSALLMWLVSLMTPPPSQQTIDRYFTRKAEALHAV